MRSAKQKISRILIKQTEPEKNIEETRTNASPFHCIAIAFLAVICYVNSLQCGLVFDDIPAIEKNEDVRPWTPVANLLYNDFWGTPLRREESHKSYRPLCVLTFRLNYWLHELEPFGYHFLNIILHCVGCLLFHRFCRKFLPESACFVAAALFSTHPIHSEAVTGVVGRAELLSSIFFLLALSDYVSSNEKRGSLDVCSSVRYFVFVVLATLSKEQGITVVGVCGLYDIVLLHQPPRLSIADKTPRSKIKGPTPTWRKDLILRLLGLCSMATIILVFRFQIMGSTLPVFNTFDNPASVASSPYRELTFNYLHSFNIWLLLYPWNLCCDWSMGSIPLVLSPWDGRNAATILMYTFLVNFLIKYNRACNQREKSIISMGLGLLIIPYIPASNLVFPVGFVVAERVLYLPSMGFCFLVAYGFHIMWAEIKWKGTRCILTIFIVTLTCLNTARTISRNTDWESEETLFAAGLKVTTQNAKLWNNLGHAIEVKGDHHKAFEYFLKATEIQPDDVGGHINLGNAYNAMGKLQEAEKSFWKARELLTKARRIHNSKVFIAPRHMELFSHLGNLISKNESRLEEAQQLLKEATNMKPDFVEAYIERATILVKLNRSVEAKKIYRQALKLDGSNPDIFYNIGVLLLEEGNEKQALAHFDKALKLDPQHEKSLINFAILSQDTGDSALRQIAHQRLKKQAEKGSVTSERIFFNMGVLAMEDMNYKEAEKYFKTAIEQRGNFGSALFNMALVLHNTGRAEESVPYLEVLLKHEPHHLKGLMLLGNIYFSHLKNYTAARNCYTAILLKSPDHVPAFHNLCAVHMQLEDLDKAESCLIEVQKLAPTEKYILDHLDMVKQRKHSRNQTVLPPSDELLTNPGINANVTLRKKSSCMN